MSSAPGSGDDQAQPPTQGVGDENREARGSQDRRTLGDLLPRLAHFPLFGNWYCDRRILSSHSNTPSLIIPLPAGDEKDREIALEMQRRFDLEGDK